MKFSPLEMGCSDETLPKTLKAIRRARGLSAADVATRMGMPLRTYEQFESGTKRVSFDRIKLFAEVTNADPYGIIYGVMFRSVDFGVASSETKMAAIMMMVLGEFVAERQDQLAYLEPTAIITAFQHAVDDLGRRLDDHESYLERWLDGRKGMIGMEAVRQRLSRRRRRD
ncbi:transcriptional regulator with XRE-family HTH domain [Sphingomonas zeicaulis]|uniref:helix-turn-helix domain-containing protein n=1 Tax=Sphingomonas zeicaulis TaxID=1632740 RepID=UPI003D25755D